MKLEKMTMNDDELDQVSGGTVLPYTVQGGDTLGKIAQQYKVSVEQIMKWNGIQDPGMVPVGATLKIKY